VKLSGHLSSDRHGALKGPLGLADNTLGMKLHKRRGEERRLEISNKDADDVDVP
jgi:hypothetical protein